MNCILCDEPLTDDDVSATVPPAHRTCVLRSGLGGIGHQLAHDYWCLQRSDPDAGLTYRQSAQLVAALVDVLGIDEAVSRSIVA